MRFSSNEGQNMAPDVILILIKDGRVEVMETGGVRIESILLNTINPFFIFGENKGCRVGLQAQQRVIWPPSLLWRHGGRLLVIKEEAGAERPGRQQSLFSTAALHLQVRQGRGWGCPSSGVTRDDSLPPGKERGGSSAPNSRELMKGKLFTLFS